MYALVSATTFGPIIVFAIVGLLRQRREWRTLVPLLTIVAYFTLLHTLTIASLRYRLPIEPILIVLAVEPLAVIAPGSISAGLLHRVEPPAADVSIAPL